jgi:O-antigen ligase
MATGSRLAVVAIAIAALYGLRNRVSRAAAVGFLIAAGAAAATNRTAVVARFESLIASGGIEGANSAGWRVGRWADNINLMKANLPWGTGWNQAQYLLGDGLGAHNGYMQVAIELGLLGAIGALVVVLGLVLTTRGAGIGASELMIFALAITVGDPGLFYPTVFYLSLVFLAPAGGTAPVASAGQGPLQPPRSSAPRVVV